MDVMGDVALELALDEYLHMLQRVAPWMAEETEETLRPFCHWLYARSAFDVPLRAADDDALSGYSAAAALDPGAERALRMAVSALQRFVAQRLPVS